MRIWLFLREAAAAILQTCDFLCCVYSISIYKGGRLLLCQALNRGDDCGGMGLYYTVNIFISNQTAVVVILNNR